MEKRSVTALSCCMEGIRLLHTGKATLPGLQDPWQAVAASSLGDQKQMTTRSKHLSNANPSHPQDGLCPGPAPVVSSGCKSTILLFVKNVVPYPPQNKKNPIYKHLGNYHLKAVLKSCASDHVYKYMHKSSLFRDSTYYIHTLTWNHKPQTHFRE